MQNYSYGQGSTQNSVNTSQAFCSCFDSDLSEEERKSVWRSLSNKAEIEKVMSLKTIHSGVLCKGHLDDNKPMMFTLKPGVLYYGNESEIYGIMKLGFQKIETYQSSSAAGGRIYGIKIFNGQAITKLFTTNRTAILQWYGYLGKFLINRNFFSKYEIQEVLGEGGFSQVYKVKDKHSKAIYAAKVVKHKMIHSDKRGVVLMKQEIEIMRHVDHPNIVKLLEVQEIHNAVILIMEYVPGQELKRVMNFLMWKDVMHIMKSLLSVTAYLESLGIIHRDLKPSNVMIVGASRDKVDPLSPSSTKVFDFGLAAFLSEKLILTKCGTPGYIAPEILHQNTKDKAVVHQNVDVFSLGIMFYEMVYRCHPFKDSASQDSKKVVKRNAAGIIDFNKPSPFKNEVNSTLLRLMKDMAAPTETRRPLASVLLKHELFGFVATSSVRSVSGSRKSDYTKILEEQVEEDRLSSYKFKTNGSRFMSKSSTSDAVATPSNSKLPPNEHSHMDRFRPAPLIMIPALAMPAIENIDNQPVNEVESPDIRRAEMSPLNNRKKYQRKEQEDDEQQLNLPQEELDQRFKQSRNRKLTDDSPLLGGNVAVAGFAHNAKVVTPRTTNRSNTAEKPPRRSVADSSKKATAGPIHSIGEESPRIGLFNLQKCDESGSRLQR